MLSWLSEFLEWYRQVPEIWGQDHTAEIVFTQGASQGAVEEITRQGSRMNLLSQADFY